MFESRKGMFERDKRSCSQVVITGALGIGYYLRAIPECDPWAVIIKLGGVG